MNHVEPVRCHCGKPLHYTNDLVQALVEDMVRANGEYILVSCGGRTWRVQRHYIALHGLASQDIPSLGFEEVN